jgi:hypothetical protein
MTQSLETHKFTIGSLLGRYERRSVVLPEFQRSFSWEKGHVARFLDDLVQFEAEYKSAPNTASYFLGPIVLIEQTDSLLLLDGQQRLATSTIALAVMRDIARGLDSVGLTKGSDLARDIERELIEKDSDPISYALTLGDVDEPYFCKAIKEDPPAVPASKIRSHGLIQNAYKLAFARFSELLQSKAYDEKVQKLKSLRDAISKGMALIAIVVQNEEDAYTIFETLNDRGLRLSVPDLVLNLLMRRAASDADRKLVRQHWNSMLKELGKRDVSRFLRHMWVSRYGDIKSEGLFAAIRRELENSRLDSVKFARQCDDECADYVSLLEQSVILPTKAGKANLLGIVKYLQITSAPPLLLAGYHCLKPGDFEKLLQAIAATHIRFVVATNQNPLSLESRLYEAARAVRELHANGDSSTKILNAAKRSLKLLRVADEKIAEAAADLYLERSEALWLLTQVANHQQSKTKEVGMDQANLEHIFPQNPDLAAWPNATDLESYVWHIGNLTILGERLNRQAQNSGFADKSTKYFAKSEIKMAQKITTYSTWTEAEVIARAKDLSGLIATVWPEVK